MIPHFKKIYSQDFEINRLQSNTEDILNPLTSAPFINGTFITLQVDVTDTIIEHKLGRTYLGWTITDLDTNSVVYRSPTVNNAPYRQIILRASVQTNVTIYIF